MFSAEPYKKHPYACPKASIFWFDIYTPLLSETQKLIGAPAIRCHFFLTYPFCLYFQLYCIHIPFWLQFDFCFPVASLFFYISPVSHPLFILFSPNSIGWYFSHNGRLGGRLGWDNFQYIAFHCPWGLPAGVLRHLWGPGDQPGGRNR